MTEETANELVDFIASHCGGKKVQLSWFGGEPTLVAHRIDQICEGLQKKGINYTSDMTTNGYLFDADLVDKAVALWKVDFVMICVDGTEKNYNSTKAYVNVIDNPYQRVMRNVGLLLSHSVYVSLRMNIDLSNYRDFPYLISECLEQFQRNPYLRVWPHPVIGEHVKSDGTVAHGSESWFCKKLVELGDIARTAGIMQNVKELPSLKYLGCQANNDSSITVTPKGHLVSCPEQFSDREIKGDLRVGVDNYEVVQTWKQFADYERCWNCTLFPFCMRLCKCSAKDLCTYKLEYITRYDLAIKRIAAG